jgi:hypothetical protein
MNTNTLSAAVVAVVAGVTTAGGVAMVGVSPEHLETLPGSPYTLTGPHQGEMLQGSWEEVTYHFPMTTFVERRDTDARMQMLINDLLDAIIAAFRSATYLGQSATVCSVTGWDSDLFSSLGGSDYQLLRFTVAVQVFSGQSYT